MNFERGKKPSEAIEIGCQTYLPVVDWVEKRIWHPPMDKEDNYRTWTWERMPDEQAQKLIEMIIGIFSYPSEFVHDLSKGDFDIAFYLKNPELFDGEARKNPRTYPELQGMEILLGGKIYKLPVLWKV